MRYERIMPCLLSICHSAYLCKIRVKMLSFSHFCFLYKACLQAKTSSLENCKTWDLRCVNMVLRTRKHGTYDDSGIDETKYRQ